MRNSRTSLSGTLKKIEHGQNKWLRPLARNGRIILEVGRGVIFRNGDRAAKLTYYSLLAIVPLLALVFAVVEALGGLGQWQNRVRRAFVDYLAPASQAQAQQWLDQFITNFHARAVGAVSMTIVFVTVLLTYVSIEDSFNQIWRGRGERHLGMRALVLAAVMPIVAILLGSSVLITGATHSLHGLNWATQHLPGMRWTFSLLPLIATSLAFSCMYRLIPFAKVDTRAALIGGISAGLVFEIAKALYAIYAVRTIRNNALYGSLAALPVFMVWVNYSWRVVLFGAEVAHATQYLDDAANDQREAKILTRHKPRAIARG